MNTGLNMGLDTGLKSGLDTGADTILVVDDNPTNLRVLVGLLSAQGYKTLVATSGERALSQLELSHPDLILLDVMMPGIDGFETCRRIKGDPATAEIPVIFMTALSDTEHKVAGFKAGAVDYVTKPFQQDEITARIGTHLTLEAQRRALKEINATKDKFFSVIGHDLRGPFTVLLGFAEILADPTRDLTPEQRQRFAALIYQSARNAYNLLENLLDWARWQRGVMESNPCKIDLQHAVEETLGLLTQTADNKKIALVREIPADTFVIADANMLSTIVRNLISNALKFTPEGGLVTVRAATDAQSVVVSVADTGAGIGPGEQAHIMRGSNPLSTKGTDGETGTGLGLLLCREFTSRQGGEFWLDSEVGRGSTFFFSLPRWLPTINTTG